METQFLTLSNFESRLGEMLLSKGHDYVENVIDLKFKSNDQYNQWQGKVRGNEIYRVVIHAELATDVILVRLSKLKIDPSCLGADLNAAYLRSRSRLS